MLYKHIIKYWIPVILYILFIFYLSSLQNPVIKVSESSGIKFYNIPMYIYHIVEFSLLSYLMWRALKNSHSRHPQFYAVLLSIAYAFSDELHQLFVPGRIFSLIDFSFDILGILALQSIIIIIDHYKKSNDLVTSRHKD